MSKLSHSNSFRFRTTILEVGKTTSGMEEAEVLELYELKYDDLLLLSSPPSHNVSSSSPEELQRLETVQKTIMETLGPSGPGLISITGVPNISLLRHNLLRLARTLALLDHPRRKQVLKEHELGSDVSLKNPDRNVSSFAMQLKYDQVLESPTLGELSGGINPNVNLDPPGDEFRNLGDWFKDLGYCMMELGLRLARICDGMIDGKELERSLLESGTAKGRLIHYHSPLDNLIIRESGKKKGSTKKQANCREKHQSFVEGLNLGTNGDGIGSCGNRVDLWQQWHYDYGIFTVLTAPVFLDPFCASANMVTDQCSTLCNQECPYPNGNSYLQIFDSNENKVLMVKTSPESFIIQVGESATILSKGKLNSTLHCVSRPTKLEFLSRETFVVFLQPPWGKTFSISDYIMEHCIFNGIQSNGQNGLTSSESNELGQVIQKVVPPLSSRLKDGMTFAEFSRETTKQYYGGSGLQSNN